MGDKYYKQERAKQKKFKESEKEMDKKYKQIIEKEREFDYLNSIRPEDSTREYNPVEYYKDGGLVKKGLPKLAKKGWK
jgi:hypothetical protein